MEHRSECLKHEAEYNLNLLSPIFGYSIPTPIFDFQEDSELKQVWKQLQKHYGINQDYAIVHAGNGKSAPYFS